MVLLIIAHYVSDPVLPKMEDHIGEMAKPSSLQSTYCIHVLQILYYCTKFVLGGIEKKHFAIYDSAREMSQYFHVHIN